MIMRRQFKFKFKSGRQP